MISPYLIRHLHEHAVDAGVAAIEELRELARSHEEFRGQLEKALEATAATFYENGDYEQALRFALEAAASLRQEGDRAARRSVLRLAALTTLVDVYEALGLENDAVRVRVELERLRSQLGARRASDTRGEIAFSVGPSSAAQRLPRLGVTRARSAVARDRRHWESDERWLPALGKSVIELSRALKGAGELFDAISMSEEAVTIYRGLAADNPAFLPDLASALNNLGNHYSEVGRRHDAIDAAWADSTRNLPESFAALLLAHRNREHLADTVADLHQATQLAVNGTDNTVVAQVRHRCRDQRTADPKEFDRNWHALDTTLPDWLTLDNDLLATVIEWITAPNYRAETEILASHDGLLTHPQLDTALDELALLDDISDARQRLHDAIEHGIDTTYRPLILIEQLTTWINLDTWADTRQALDTTPELMHHDSRTLLRALAENSPDDVGLRVHRLVLELAHSNSVAFPFDALNSPESASEAFAELRSKDDWTSIDTLSVLLLTATQPDNQTSSTALIHLAIARHLAGEHQQVESLILSARKTAPNSEPEWLALLVEIAPTHPNVTALTAMLTSPLPDDTNDTSGE